MATGRGKTQAKEKGGVIEEITGGRRGSESAPKMETLYDMISAMQQNIVTLQQDMQSNFKEIKQEIAQVKKLEEAVLATKQDLTEVKEQMVTIGERMDEKDKRIEALEEKIMLMELRSKEKNIRIRGLKEERSEELEKRIIAELAKFIEYDAEELEAEIDSIFRVNSKFARENNVPRDIIVTFLKKETRDALLREQAKQKLRIENQELTLLKEIPIAIRRRRKKYTPLTETLKKKNILYRWEVIEGLSFTYKSKNWTINTEEKMKDFMQKNKKELTK
ncbi:uncharacterized protein LOC125440155 [Sphaerodactylus townsendi]|uniref:uncharacterized protein LOC125440155 n=1 Tax=Sphaerodactylus townsendi TaxID=933632 RepID=UPI0020268EB3|nr:uncharacterized protein LOC125440155 [Sphaerodactylus townsendi]